MFSGISSSLLLCQPASSRTRTQWFPGCTEALARCSFMDVVLACDVADREHPFCIRGSEKIDVNRSGGRKQPAGGYSCVPTVVTAFPSGQFCPRCRPRIVNSEKSTMH